MKISKLLLVCAVLLAAKSLSAQQGTSILKIGPSLYGLSADGESNSYFGGGVAYEYGVSSNLSILLGVDYNAKSESTTVSGVKITATASIVTVAPEARWYFGEATNGFYLGLQPSLHNYKVSAAIGSTTTDGDSYARFGAGGCAGLSVPLGQFGFPTGWRLRGGFCQRQYRKKRQVTTTSMPKLVSNFKLFVLKPKTIPLSIFLKTMPNTLTISVFGIVLILIFLFLIEHSTAQQDDSRIAICQSQQGLAVAIARAVAIIERARFVVNCHRSDAANNPYTRRFMHQRRRNSTRKRFPLAIDARRIARHRPNIVQNRPRCRACGFRHGMRRAPSRRSAVAEGQFHIRGVAGERGLPCCIQARVCPRPPYLRF